MDKLHYIHSRGGRIGGRADTSAADTDAMVEALRRDGRRHLIIHFHGGLVSKENGLKIAENLFPIYSPSIKTGGYPIFFVWESGAWETIRNNITELADEPVFKQLLRKVLEYAFEKVGGRLGDAGRGGLALGGGRAQVTIELEKFWRLPSKETIPFRDLDAREDAAEARAAFSDDVSGDEIQADLEQDTEFQKALATLPDLAPATRSSFAPEAVAEHRSAFSELVSEQFSAEAGARGVISLLAVARFIARVLRGILKRYSSKRDHGLYATCVEEIIRGFKVGGSSVNEWAKALEWNRMKKDTRDAFGPDPDLHAGTALLARLRDALGNGLELDRVTLIGHSTGAIYIANWLQSSAGYLPAGLRQDVIYLAPAINYAEFSELLKAQQSRIGKFRMFAMQDALEKDDQLWGQDEELPKGKDWRRFIYPSSLLYLVSGILESRVEEDGTLVDEPDMPIVGMARFFENREVYSDASFPEIAQARDWLKQANSSIVWSRTTNAGDGLNSAATDHGAFDDEDITLKSMYHIVTSGF